MSTHHQSLGIIGSTGSLGRKVFEGAMLGRRRVLSLAGGANVERLMVQALECRPQVVSVSSRESAKKLEEAFEGKFPASRRPRVVWGSKGLFEVARSADDLALTAIGLVGLEASLETLRKGGRVVVGTKEIGVVAGVCLNRMAREHGGEVLPLDSELTALLQLKRACGPQGPKKLILTASGGPLLGKKVSDLEKVSVKEVVSHPIWPMGPKVSVDSATLFNKSLEIMVASRLFSVAPEALSAVVHPQCRIHAAVETGDGAVLLQAAPTDMLWAVGFALGLRREETGLCAPCVASMSELTFEEIEEGDFPAFDAGISALSEGGGGPAFLAGADEVLVDAFLKETIGYLDLIRGLKEALKSNCFEQVKEKNPSLVQEMIRSWDHGKGWAKDWVESKGQ